MKRIRLSGKWGLAGLLLAATIGGAVLLFRTGWTTEDAEQTLRRARWELASGHYTRVEKLVRRIPQTSPLYFQSLLLLGDSDKAQGHWQRAVEHYRHVADPAVKDSASNAGEDNKSLREIALSAAGDLLLEHGRVSEAQACF